MKVHDDSKCYDALDRWLYSLMQTSGTEDVEEVLIPIKRQLSEAPEMTPIEQLVFFCLKEHEDKLNICIDLQYQISSYRVDFLVRKHSLNPRKFESCVRDRIVIECDGHDFHEKTKWQAQKDKQRDIGIQLNGFKVFRFTGSEIWQTNGSCVVKALQETY